MNLYAIPSLVAGGTNFALGAYALYKNPKKTLNRIFSLYTFSLAIWGFAEFGYRITTDPNIAAPLLNRAGAIGWCFMVSLYVHFLLTFSRKEKILKNVFTYLALYIPSSVFLYLNYTTGLIFSQEAVKMYGGYTFPPGDLVWTYVLYYTSFYIFAIYLLAEIVRKGAGIEKKQAKPILVGSTFFLIAGTTTDIALPAVGYSIVEMAASFSIVWAACIAYAIFKYKLFVIEPITEEPKLTETVYDLPAGNSYLMKEPKAEKSFEIFTDLVTHGIEGFCITRLHPSIVRKRYGLEKTPILWLSRQERLEDCITPSSLGVLADTIADFVGKSWNSVVLLDGLEYLILNTDFSRILKMCYDIDKTIREKKSRLILSVNPLLLEKDEIALLEEYTKPLPQNRK